MRLATLLKDKNTLFGEDHHDRSLSEKYRVIFASAHEAGRRDCIVECPPSMQDGIDERIKLLKEIKNSSGPEVLLQYYKYYSEQDTGGINCQTVLAALYDINLHAVDVGLRQDLGLDLYFRAHEMVCNFPTDARISLEAYFLQMSDETLGQFRECVGEEISREQVYARYNEMVEDGGVRDLLRQRVEEGDALIAQKVDERVGDRNFIGILGRAHLSRVREDGTPCNLASILKAAGQCAAVDMTPEGSAKGGQKPDYTMDAEGNLTPVQAQPEANTTSWEAEFGDVER